MVESVLMRCPLMWDWIAAFLAGGSESTSLSLSSRIRLAVAGTDVGVASLLVDCLLHFS